MFHHLWQKLWFQPKFDYKQGPPKICSGEEAIFTYAESVSPKKV